MLTLKIGSAASNRGQAMLTYFICLAWHDSVLLISMSCFLFTHAKKL